MGPGFGLMINSRTWIIIVHLTYRITDFDQLSKHRSFYVKTYHQSIFSECRAFPYVQRQSSMSAGDHMVDNEQGRYCHSERERSFFKIAFSWDAHDDDQLWWGGKVLLEIFTPSILVFLPGKGSDDQAGLDDLSAADQDPPPLRAPPTKSSWNMQGRLCRKVCHRFWLGMTLKLNLFEPWNSALLNLRDSPVSP